MEQYECEARSRRAFIAQVVRYISSGHVFYVRCKIKEKPDPSKQKDPREVDRELVSLYGIARKRWQRKRRHLKHNAGIHYLRYGEIYVFMLTKGKHEDFYRDHGHNIQSIERKALAVFGYKIRYAYSEAQKRMKVFVRLDDEEKRKVGAHMMAICSWESYRDKERMEREFRRLQYQIYEPVHDQLMVILKAVNRARRKRGFDVVSPLCIPQHVNITKVYVDERGGGVELEQRSKAVA